MSSERDEGLGGRLSRQSEEALGRIAEELAGNPMIAGALGRALSAREKAVQAQEAAMGALGIPSAADVERVTRRLRSVSQRLETIEDHLDRIETRLDGIGRDGGHDEREGRLETRLAEISADLRSLRDALAPGQDLPPIAQERLSVGQATAAAAPAPRSRARTGSGSGRRTRPPT